MRVCVSEKGSEGVLGLSMIFTYVCMYVCMYLAVLWLPIICGLMMYVYCSVVVYDQ